MGLGKFLSKATKAVGKVAKSATHTVTHAAEDVGKTAAHAASGAASGVGKGLQAATGAIGKVGIGKFNIGNITKTITHAGIGPISLAGASDALTKGIAKISAIPVLGSIIGVATPLHFVEAINNVTRGQRIDRAAMGALTSRMKDYKNVAPYAASVIALVPAIGPGIGAGIAAGAALADGKRWDQIAIEAAKGAIPGGNIAKAAFDVAHAAASGKSIDKIALAALPVDDKVKQAIGAGLALTKDIASGKRVDQALLAHVNDALNIAGIKGSAADAIASGAHLAADLAAGKNVQKALMNRVSDAVKLAGPEIAKAMQVGTAIGTAGKIQQNIMKEIGSPHALSALQDLGVSALGKNPILQQGLNMSQEPMFKKGFAVASGVMSGHGVNETQLHGIRSALDAEGKKGFDAATSYFIGKHAVNSKPPSKRNPPAKHVKTTGGKVVKVPSKTASPAQAFGYYATHGLVGAGDQQKEVLVKKMAETSPEMRDGAGDAVRAVAVDRKLSPSNRGFWQNMHAWFTANEHGHH